MEDVHHHPSLWLVLALCFNASVVFLHPASDPARLPAFQSDLKAHVYKLPECFWGCSSLFALWKKDVVKLYWHSHITIPITSEISQTSRKPSAVNAVLTIPKEEDMSAPFFLLDAFPLTVQPSDLDPIYRCHRSVSFLVCLTRMKSRTLNELLSHRPPPEKQCLVWSTSPTFLSLTTISQNWQKPGGLSTTRTIAPSLREATPKKQHMQ